MCSSNSDCTLKSRKVRRIEKRIEGNGGSFTDCVSRCGKAFNFDKKKWEGSRSKSRTSRPYLSPKSVSAEDCNCYCSMFHDPCIERKPFISAAGISL